MFKLGMKIFCHEDAEFCMSNGSGKKGGGNGKMWVHLSPTLTDFRGPTNFMCYRRISVTANIRNKRKLVEEAKNSCVLQAEFH